MVETEYDFELERRALLIIQLGKQLDVCYDQLHAFEKQIIQL